MTAQILALDLTFKGHRVRMVGTPERPEWIAADVCGVLDLANHRQVVSGFSDDEKGVHSVDTLGGAQRMLTVTEPGLYRLISQSRKPEAQDFQRWIHHDVLPSIRKTGTYSLIGSTVVERLPEKIGATLQVLDERTERLDERTERIESKIDYQREILDSVRPRRDFSEQTRNRGVRCKRDYFNNRCPFCSRFGTSHFDHWDGNRSNNSVSNLALPCTVCHIEKSKDEQKFRQKYRSEQDTFQRKLEKTPFESKRKRSVYRWLKKRCAKTNEMF